MFPQFTREYVRDGISYANLTLLQLSIPPYRGLEDGGKRGAGKKKGTGRQNGKTDRLGDFKHANQLFEAF